MIMKGQNSNYYALVDEDGKTIVDRSQITNFRGETFTVIGGQPPHKPESEGKVFVIDGRGFTAFYYPSVFNLNWKQLDQ